MNKHYPGRCAFSIFTMIELMVVIGIILILAALLLPTLSTSKNSARGTFCKNNVKNLVMATFQYSQEWEVFPAWGSDKKTSNLTRWHGKRVTETNTALYDPEEGNLFVYLKSSDVVCPNLDKTVDVTAQSIERGGGGYGYNLYVGTRAYFVADPDSEEAYKSGIVSKDLKHPDGTVLFTDTAANLDPSGEVSSNSAAGALGEYSICTAPFSVNDKITQISLGEDPSIHFRHNKQTNVGWGDGHVDSELMKWTVDAGWKEKSLGFWGDKDDNSLFKPN